MYLWNIEKLKSKLTASPLTEREVLPYFLVFLGLYGLVPLIPIEGMNFWDYVGGAWSLVLTLLGSIYLYFKNGGSSGHYFLQRYFAVGWVVAVRWAAIFIPIFITYVFFFGFSESTTWH